MNQPITRNKKGERPCTSLRPGRDSPSRSAPSANRAGPGVAGLGPGRHALDRVGELPAGGQATRRVTRAQDASGVLLLLHDQGGILAKVAASAGVTQDKQRFKIPLAQLGTVPCQVEVRQGGLSATKRSAGPRRLPPGAGCQITSPSPGAALKINTDVPFAGAGDPQGQEGRTLDLRMGLWGRFDGRSRPRH